LRVYEVEKRVNEIWTLSSGSYYEDNKYKDFVYTGNDGSSLLAVAVPRDGGNIMSSAHITALADRFSSTQDTTVCVGYIYPRMVVRRVGREGDREGDC
jgi:hypothetical protein